MNIENYRLIPNEEYERLVVLANLNEKAIKEEKQDAYNGHKEAYDDVLRTASKYAGEIRKIKRNLDDIIEFMKPYYCESYIKEKFVELIDTYIEQMKK
jgi:Zn-dependent M32 family carboxypeptidase